MKPDDKIARTFRNWVHHTGLLLNWSSSGAQLEDRLGAQLEDRLRAQLEHKLVAQLELLDGLLNY